MKKIKIIALCLAVVLMGITLCSCTVKDITYEPRTVEMNYNNISAKGYFTYWMTSDAAYYYNSFYGDMRRIEQDGMSTISEVTITDDTAFCIHDDTIYVLEEEEVTPDGVTDYFVRGYLTATGESVFSHHIQGARSVDRKFIVLNDRVFIIAETDKSSNTLMVMDLNTGKCETVAEKVMSMGVDEGRLIYVVDEVGFLFTVHEYEKNSGIKTGEFEFVLYQYEYLEPFVNYVDGKIIFIHSKLVEEENEYSVVEYDRKTGKTEQTSLGEDVSVSEAIAYGSSLFISGYSHTDEEERSMVYLFDLETKELSKLADFEDTAVSLFVGSEEGVFVRNNLYDGVLYCSVDGERTNLVAYKGIFGFGRNPLR